VSDESKAGAPKKLSTKDILAAARAQAGKAAGAAPAPAAPEAAPTPVETAPVSAAAPAAASPAPAAKPAATKTPRSTADILAAARAQAAGGAAPAATSASAASPTAPAAKPAAAGKPKSTADILAAARAAAGKGGASSAPSASGEKPAPKAKPMAPAAAKPGAAETQTGPKMSVEEMLAAVRPGAAPIAAVAPAAEPKAARPASPPPMPHKPQAQKPAPAPDTMRRSVLTALLLAPVAIVSNLFGTAFAAAWTMLAATTGIATLATARFMLPNVLTEPPSKFKIGSPSDFDLGTVATRFVATNGVWIVHTDGYKGKNLIYALISVCTHLGCTPSWLEGERKFKCPCHGSGFYITGINFEGPAPRPLERAGIRLAEDGMLEVDKSVKFQEEMGQWNDPTSFYEVVG
jgi:cytochrome b6-f complex iron-sulfur subunit